MYRKEDAYMNILFEPSSFQLPLNNEPLIMIGPGTGIAPFISFMEEITNKNLQNKCILYFGCRKANSDYIYRDKLAEWVAEKKLDLRVAFSREKEK